MTNAILTWPKRHVAVSLLVLTAIGLTLRLFAATRPFEQDELVTLRFAVSGWREFWAHIPHDHTPPLFYLLAWVWHRSMPVSEILSRVPTLVFSAAAIPACYWAFSAWREKGTALLAACLLAFSPIMVLEGSAARAYGLLSVLALLFLGLVFRWANAPRRRTAILTGSLAFFGSMTHLEFLLLLPAVVFAWLCIRPLRAHWRSVFFWIICALAPTVWWSIAAYPSHVGFSFHTTWFSQLNFPKIFSVFTWGAPGVAVSALDPRILWVAAASLTIMSLWLVAPWFTDQVFLRRTRFDMWTVMVLAAMLLILPLATNVTTMRYYLVCYLAVFFLFAVGIGAIRPRVLAAGSVLLFLVLASWQQPKFLESKRRLQNSILYVRENILAGDLLLVSPFGNAILWRYYLPSDLRVEGVLPVRLQSGDAFADSMQHMARIVVTDETVKDLSLMLQSERRVWFLGEAPQQSNANRSHIIRNWFLANGWEQRGAISPESQNTMTVYERIRSAPAPSPNTYTPGAWLKEYLWPINQKR